MERKMHAGAIKHLYQRARELRNNSTHAKSILWGYLRTKQFGLKFRRQHPYSIYILDFYCHSLKLVIEVDGSIHNQPDIKLNDEERLGCLQKDGLVVLRFSNDQIERKFEDTIRIIEEFIMKHKDDKRR